MRKAAPDDDTTRFRYALLLREIDRMRTASGTSTLALMLIQLSGLESVNGRFGYLGGDKVLEDFAGRLRAVAREQDRSFEINSRTFALLIRNPLHEGHAALAAERVARVAQEPVLIGAAHARVKARIGISLLPEPARSSEELLRQCEIALGIARGRDEPHVMFTPSLGAESRADAGHSWFDVEEALRGGEFEVFYQPQVDLATGRLAGAEALVRWQKPGSGYVSPGYFMPAIEHSRGIRSLLWFVLNAALRQSAEWARACPDFGVAVNLATGNLDDPELVDIVENALAVWCVPPEKLTLELTESSIMQNPAQSVRILGRLRQAGLRVSIDDFGTGYSSLAYLRDLPADELKVDRAFIANVTSARRDHNIVASVVQLAHAVDLEVVAEGIEDRVTLAALAAMGCDLGQGYHFGKPMPAGEFQQAWIDAAGGACAAIAERR